MMSVQELLQPAPTMVYEHRNATLLRIALINSVGFSASTAVPFWIGGAGGHFGFPSWGAGAIASGQLACAALFNAATPWLFRRSHVRKLGLIAAMAASIGNGLAWLGGSSAFIAGCLVFGASCGVILNVTNRLVSASTSPQAGYAMLQLVEVLFCIGFFLGVPPFIHRFGFLAVFAAMAALSAAIFPLLASMRIRAHEGPAHVNLDRQSNCTNAGVLCLCAAALLFAGYSSVSCSLVPIGAAIGLSVLWVGRIMALGLLASLGAAILARGLGERVGVLLPLLAGAGVLGGDMLIVTRGGEAAFIGGAVILFMGTVFLSPYIYAQLAALDRAGSWASIAPGFILTGVAFGPAIAGAVSRGVDFMALGSVAMACIAAAAVLFIFPEYVRLRAKRARTAQANSRLDPIM